MITKRIVAVQNNEINLSSGKHATVHKCGWCGCPMGVTIGEKIEGDSHGICLICDEQTKKDFKEKVARHSGAVHINPKFEGVAECLAR